MTANRIYGGRRARAVRSSVYQYIQGKLNTLGWFQAGGNFTPITFIDELIGNANDPIVPNTLALADGESRSTDLELGYDSGVDTWAFSVDFFAENDAVGLAVIKDIQRVLEGRYAPIGAGLPIIPLYDTSQATPPLLGYLDIEQVAAHRMSGSQPWLKYYYTCHFECIDYDYA